MRTGHVYYKNQLAGMLSQLDNGSFVFQYDEQWLNDSSKPSISLTFPKKKMEFQSSTLFPFFFIELGTTVAVSDVATKFFSLIPALNCFF